VGAGARRVQLLRNGWFLTKTYWWDLRALYANGPARLLPFLCQSLDGPDNTKLLVTVRETGTKDLTVVTGRLTDP
jgi:hypothetical protein